MAIDRHAPEYVILSILKANKDAAKIPCKNGALPLHYAVEQNMSASVIVELIKSYPEALDIKDGDKNTPRDFVQRNDLSREALMRPTSCWVEDSEKEEYLKRVSDRRIELRQKIATLKKEIEKSNERVKMVSDMVSNIEPRIENVDSRIIRDEEYRSQLFNMKSAMCDHLGKIKDRLEQVENKVSQSNKTEVNMMNSLLKREYLENVKSSYEKILRAHQQIKRDLNEVKIKSGDRLDN